MIRIISIHQFYNIAYKCEGFIFWRQIDPEKPDSDIEVKQVVPNANIKKLIQGA